MAYCILSKDGRQGNILHFLADAITDYAKIIDTCDPGSTLKVLDTANKGKDIADYMKAPCGKWVKTSKKGADMPDNNVAISIFDSETKIGKKPVSELQSDIKVSEQGLVTGISNYVTGYEELFSKTPDGHFVALKLENPNEADKVDLICGANSKKDLTPDTNGEYVFRLENIDEASADGVTVNFKKNSDSTVLGSCVLDFSQVERA